MQEFEGCAGCMFAVRASVSTVEQAILQSGVSPFEACIASVNGELSVVLSGKEEAVTRVLDANVLAGSARQKLDVSHAFHSPLTTGILGSFRGSLEIVASRLRPPSLRWFSTLRGGEAHEEVSTVEYWLQHVDHPVLYKQALEASWELGGRTYVEMGPNATLTRLGRGSGLGSILSVKSEGVETHWLSTTEIIPPASTLSVNHSTGVSMATSSVSANTLDAIDMHNYYGVEYG
jgi:acyl transferase domain-containing protein